MMMHSETLVGKKILGTILVRNHCARAPSQSLSVRNLVQLIREYGLERWACQRRKDSNFDTTCGKLLKFQSRFAAGNYAVVRHRTHVMSAAA